MADMLKEIEHLDDEFHELLSKIEKFMSAYTYREKVVATNWLSKLKKSHDTNEERKLRNRFMKYFVNNQEASINVFQTEPFNKLPKDFNVALMGLKGLLPKDPNEALNPSEDEKRSYIAELFKGLPDKGDFLAQQPVPIDGYFSILIFKADETIVCQRP